MTASQRFALTAFLLSATIVAGAMLFIWPGRDAERLSSPALRSTVPPQNGERHPDRDQWRLRFGYVPPEVGILNAPPSGGSTRWERQLGPAADPETWAVDVKAPTGGEPRTTETADATPTRPPTDQTKRRPNHRRYTLGARLEEISPRAEPRLLQKFQSAKVSWPPTEIALVAIKNEKSLYLYARSGTKDWTLIHGYPVLAASGRSGPKLRRGDRQVPEGIYRISYLNPNSRYHVSLRVNYPNRFDRKMAAKDGRADLGGDIMIHGKNVSAGCLAMGDEAAEELFLLVAKVGKSNARVIIAPSDLRRVSTASHPNSPVWLPELYESVKTALAELPAPPAKPSLLSLLGLSP